MPDRDLDKKISKMKKDILNNLLNVKESKKITPINELDTNDSFIDISFDNINKNIEKSLNVVDIDLYARLVLAIQNFHNHFSKIDYGQPINQSAFKSERKLYEILLEINERSDYLDNYVQKIYQGNELSIEAKTMFRQALVRLFGTNISNISNYFSFNKHKPNYIQELSFGSQGNYIIDVFAMPVFGSIDNIRKLLDHPFAAKKICNLLVECGYISPKSEHVALLSLPLKPKAMQTPSALNALSSIWGSLVINEKSIPKELTNEIRTLVLDSLDKFVIDSGVCGFVIPGIRVWRGSQESLYNSNELLTKWFTASIESKTAAEAWWRARSGNILINAGIQPGSIMFRPPVTPLVAQSQAVAWHLTQQVYERLNTQPFSEIVMTKLGNDIYSLVAFNNRSGVITKSDNIQLFDITTSTRDFNSLIIDECGANGPTTQTREICR